VLKHGLVSVIWRRNFVSVSEAMEWRRTLKTDLLGPSDRIFPEQYRTNLGFSLT